MKFVGSGRFFWASIKGIQVQEVKPWPGNIYVRYSGCLKFTPKLLPPLSGTSKAFLGCEVGKKLGVLWSRNSVPLKRGWRFPWGWFPAGVNWCRNPNWGGWNTRGDSRKDPKALSERPSSISGRSKASRWEKQHQLCIVPCSRKLLHSHFPRAPAQEADKYQGESLSLARENKIIRETTSGIG